MKKLFIVFLKISYLNFRKETYKYFNICCRCRSCEPIPSRVVNLNTSVEKKAIVVGNQCGTLLTRRRTVPFFPGCGRLVGPPKGSTHARRRSEGSSATAVALRLPDELSLILGPACL